MGRKKIRITPILDEHIRQNTFSKRKAGLFKKAMELSILCGCEVALMVFSPAERLYTFSSHGMSFFMSKFNSYTGPVHELSDIDYEKEFGSGKSSSGSEPSPESSDSFSQPFRPSQRPRLSAEGRSSGSGAAKDPSKLSRISSSRVGERTIDSSSLGINPLSVPGAVFGLQPSLWNQTPQQQLLQQQQTQQQQAQQTQQLLQQQQQQQQLLMTHLMHLQSPMMNPQQTSSVLAPPANVLVSSGHESVFNPLLSAVNYLRGNPAAASSSSALFNTDVSNPVASSVIHSTLLPSASQASVPPIEVTDPNVICPPSTAPTTTSSSAIVGVSSSSSTADTLNVNSDNTDPSGKPSKPSSSEADQKPPC